jgi:hypothetical protein
VGLIPRDGHGMKQMLVADNDQGILPGLEFEENIETGPEVVRFDDYVLR